MNSFICQLLLSVEISLTCNILITLNYVHVFFYLSLVWLVQQVPDSNYLGIQLSGIVVKWWVIGYPRLSYPILNLSWCACALTILSPLVVLPSTIRKTWHRLEIWFTKLLFYVPYYRKMLQEIFIHNHGYCPLLLLKIYFHALP